MLVAYYAPRPYSPVIHPSVTIDTGFRQPVSCCSQYSEVLRKTPSDIQARVAISMRIDIGLVSEQGCQWLKLCAVSELGYPRL